MKVSWKKRQSLCETIPNQSTSCSASAPSALSETGFLPADVGLCQQTMACTLDFCLDPNRRHSASQLSNESLVLPHNLRGPT